MVGPGRHLTSLRQGKYASFFSVIKPKIIGVSQLAVQSISPLTTSAITTVRLKRRYFVGRGRIPILYVYSISAITTSARSSHPVADPDQAFGEGSQIGGRRNVFSY